MKKNVSTKVIKISRIGLLVFTALFLEISCFSQDLIIPKKRIYTDQDEKLYVNKALPLYLRFATSPDENAETHLLKSKVTAKYTNPMYLDTEGYNSFHAPSAVDTSTKEVVYPLQDIIFEVYADSKAPVTKVNYGKVLTVFRNGKTYCGGVTEVTISAVDALSGLEKIYYSLNNSPFTEYSQPISLKEGEHVLKYYSTDNVGNMEELNESQIVIDASDPATQLEVVGDKHNDIISGRSSLKLIAADKHGIKAIYYTLDDQPEKTYNNPINASYLKQGEHRLSYYSVDRLGNKELVKHYVFYVDKSAPRIVEEIVGNTFVANGKEYSSGRSKFKLITIDNKAGVKEAYYSINGSEYEKYEKPFYLSDNSGSIVIKSYAVDYVNNKSTSVQNSDGADIPFIDLSGPMLQHTYRGPVFTFSDTVFISHKTKIILQAKDYESGISKIDYIINENSSEEYKEPFSVEKEGKYEVKFMGYDNVENTNNESFSFIVDTTGPQVFQRFSVVSEKKNNGSNSVLEVYPSHVVLFVSATDRYSGYDKMYYSINGSPDKECFGAIRDFISGRDYSILIKAFDKLGNKKEYLINFTVK